MVAKTPALELNGEVEVDEVYVLAGYKGQPAAVSKRGGLSPETIPGFRMLMQENRDGQCSPGWAAESAAVAAAMLYAGGFFHAEAASAGHNLLAPLQPQVRAGLFRHLIADLRRNDRPRPH